MLNRFGDLPLLIHFLCAVKVSAFLSIKKLCSKLKATAVNLGDDASHAGLTALVHEV